MTTRLAAVLTLIIALAVAADLLLAGGAGSLFLARKFQDLIVYVTFWR